MKKKRKISLSNPRMQQIAQNFRYIWHEAVWLQYKGLKESKKFIQAENLMYALKNSILGCATCSKLEGDRIYNPPMDAWFCPKCWTLNKEFYISMMEKKKRDENLGDFNEEMMEGFAD